MSKEKPTYPKLLLMMADKIATGKTAKEAWISTFDHYNLYPKPEHGFKMKTWIETNGVYWPQYHLIPKIPRQIWNEIYLFFIIPTETYRFE